MSAPMNPSEETATVTTTTQPNGVEGFLHRRRIMRDERRAVALEGRLRKAARRTRNTESTLSALDILTCESSFWLRHTGFTRFIHKSPCFVDWWEAIRALDAGRLQAPAERQRILRLAASVASGAPVDLRDCFKPGGHGTQALLEAIYADGIRSEAS